VNTDAMQFATLLLAFLAQGKVLKSVFAEVELKKDHAKILNSNAAK